MDRSAVAKRVVARYLSAATTNKGLKNTDFYSEESAYALKNFDRSDVKEAAPTLLGVLDNLKAKKPVEKKDVQQASKQVADLIDYLALDSDKDGKRKALRIRDFLGDVLRELR